MVCEARMAEAEEKIVGGYFCVVCNKECTHKHHLRNHLLSHFYKKFDPFIPQDIPFACSDCGKPNRSKIDLIHHYSWTHGYFGEITGLSKDVLGLRKMSVRNPDRNNGDHVVLQGEPVIEDVAAAKGEAVACEAERERDGVLESSEFQPIFP